jgi:AcrR family transcriptional regulator
MPRVTAARADATRLSILRAARDVFVAKGFHEATTQDVARGAGISVGTIYTWFKSKDELIHESVLLANRDETDVILQTLPATGTVREKMARAIRGWYAYTIEAPGVPAFLAEAWAAASRKPLIRDLIARRRERIVTVATVLLGEGIARGELAPRMDIDATARALAALLDGIVLEHIASGAGLSAMDVERRAMLLLDPRAGAPRS